VVGQAGNSEPGRELAAKYADTLLSFGNNVESMKAFREDMHARLLKHGRKPSDCKILFLITPILGETEAEARERIVAGEKAAATPEALDRRLWGMSYVTGGQVDFGKFDLDGPVPDIKGNGEQSSYENFRKRAAGKTLREALTTYTPGWGLDLVGTSDTVAGKMGDIMEAVGGDGFLLYPEMTRRSIAEITDGLVPELRKRGLVRTNYTYDNFRDNLLEF
jgi:alkanesulfonate monooxygenase SsuD/methylene tetrahydromethanopterin reductase-like flavin-dependent oxidoreductase (luciferase family)